MNSIDKLINNLNKEQKDAVLSTEGPNLIVAGAGSGKTKVLTTKLAYIISEKKAREMKPDFFLVTPWGFIDEFKKREIKWRKTGGKFIVPFPKMRII